MGSTMTRTHTGRLLALAIVASLLNGCGGGDSPTGPENGAAENEPPTASISSPSDGSEFEQGESVTFQGSADDPEDSALSGDALSWSSDIDGQLGTGQDVTTSSLSAGEHAVTLTATDSDGATDQESISITVGAGPSASITSPSDQSVFSEGETINLEGSGGDAADGDLTLTWSSDRDGQIATGRSASVSSLAAGPHTLVLTATDSDGNSDADSAAVLVEAPGFDIRVRFVDSLSTSEQSTVEAGLSPWENVITGDLEGGFPPSDAAESCLIEEKGIDDLVLAVRVADLDGTGGTLAQARPCLMRTNASGEFTTSVSGLITIDAADRDNPDLEQIITHEAGHALGIGPDLLQGWKTNVSGLDSRNPTFSGSHAVSAFQNDLDGEAYLNDGVPLANEGSAGTFGGHWREANFDTELMTGFIDSGVDMPLSRVTVASLADIGYTVDLSTADPFALPMPQRAIWTASADATLSRPTSSSENFGGTAGTALDSMLVAGANNAQIWSTDPEDEVFAGLLRLDAPSTLPSGVTVDGTALGLEVADRNAETTGHDIEVTPVTSTWSESSVTWDTRPSTGSSPVMVFDFQRCNSCRLTTTALDDLAVDWLDGTAANHGLILQAPDASTDPTFSVGYWSRHTESPLLRPFMVVEASTGSSLRTDRAEETGEEIPLGDDIASGPVFGIDSSGRIVEVRRIR